MYYDDYDDFYDDDCYENELDKTYFIPSKFIEVSRVFNFCPFRISVNIQYE